MNFGVPLISSGFGLPHYLAFSVLVFAIGLYGVLTQRSLSRVLLSLLPLFGGILVSLAAFGRYLHPVGAPALGIAVFGSGLAYVALGWAIAHPVDQDLDSLDSLRG